MRLKQETLEKLAEESEQHDVSPSEFVRYITEFYFGETTARAP